MKTNCYKYYRIPYALWIFTFLLAFISVGILATEESSVESIKAAMSLYFLSLILGFLIWFSLLIFQEKKKCNRGFVHAFGFIGFIIFVFIIPPLISLNKTRWVE